MQQHAPKSNQIIWGPGDELFSSYSVHTLIIRQMPEEFEVYFFYLFLLVKIAFLRIKTKK